MLLGLIDTKVPLSVLLSIWPQVSARRGSGRDGEPSLSGRDLGTGNSGCVKFVRGAEAAYGVGRTCRAALDPAAAAGTANPPVMMKGEGVARLLLDVIELLLDKVAREYFASNQSARTGALLVVFSFPKYILPRNLQTARMIDKNTIIMPNIKATKMPGRAAFETMPVVLELLLRKSVPMIWLR